MTDAPTRVVHAIDASGAGWPALFAARAMAEADPERTHELLTLPEERRAVRAAGAGAVVHAWGHDAAVHADAAVVSLTAPPGPALAPAARRALDRAGALTASTDALARAWAGRLGREVQTVATPVRPPSASRDEVRAALGVEEHEIVFALASASPETTDAHACAHAAGVQSVAGRDTAMLLPAGARGLERASRFVSRHGHRWRTLVTESPLGELAPGVDLALWRADPTLRLGVRSRRCAVSPDGPAWFAAAGVRVVAERDPAVVESLGADGATFTDPGDTLAFTRGIVAALRDGGSLARAAEIGRRLAERRTPGGALAAFGALYEGAYART